MEQDVQNVALALVQREKGWLVAQRHAGAHLGGFWEFPGGKCMPGESVQSAAIRELREECGVVGRPWLCLSPRRCDYDDRVVVLHPVVCEYVRGTARALESQQCRWVSLGELARLEMPLVNREIMIELEQALTAAQDLLDDTRFRAQRLL